MVSYKGLNTSINWRCYNIWFDDVAVGIVITADELR